ncbi:histidine phosphatase family protein [Kribbia dieselivorans]|uniref:histidine phosphatase family protein n=1 Tax=Kribbia dieselivorans TaxID=331526 RepID=UPI000839436F|nr:histidine phosphatase family protein [Kribbia dieselivorans]
MGRRLRIEADGGSRGNPGVAGYGAVVRDGDTGAVLIRRAAPLGKASNNVAEYRGLIAGLEAVLLIEPGAQVVAAMDSKLVVEQMSGNWKIKHPAMRTLALQARDLATEITQAGGTVMYTWIPRAQNGLADTLSNDGMDGKEIDDRSGWEAELGLPAAADTRPHSDPGLPTFGRVESPPDDLVDEDEVPATIPHRRTPTRIVLVRHGVTAFTEQGLLDGRGGADPELSRLGIEQAQAAARATQHLVGEDEVRVITSSLARARQTGGIIAKALDVAPSIDPDWDEQSFGDWDGAAMKDLFATSAAEFDRLRVEPDYARPGGESHAQLSERVLSAFARVVAPGGTSVVVCHRKPIMVVLADLLEVPMAKQWRLAAAPASLSAIEIWPNREAIISFTNRT